MESSLWHNGDILLKLKLIITIDEDTAVDVKCKRQFIVWHPVRWTTQNALSLPVADWFISRQLWVIFYDAAAAVQRPFVHIF